jgi:hypothetical protein
MRGSLKEVRAPPAAKYLRAQFLKLFCKIGREGLIEPRFQRKSIRLAKLDRTVCYIELAAQFRVGVSRYACGQACNKC